MSLDVYVDQCFWEKKVSHRWNIPDAVTSSERINDSMSYALHSADIRRSPFKNYLSSSDCQFRQNLRALTVLVGVTAYRWDLLKTKATTMYIKPAILPLKNISETVWWLLEMAEVSMEPTITNLLRVLFDREMGRTKKKWDCGKW